MDTSAITVALDAMGGDYGPEIVIPGAAMALEANPGVQFLLYGDQLKIDMHLSEYRSLGSVSKIIHTDKMIRNEDKPSAALRAGKDSSMRMAIEAVQKKEAQAVVSAGNTGALMAMAKMVLKTVPGIHRPAIGSVFPTIGEDTVVLDLGANVLVDAANLVEFAILGTEFAKVRLGKERPTVGLLNVGSEETKGPDHVRGAAAILSKLDFPGEFRGFVEGTDITKGTVDVVVTDGYAGNIALKTAEGVGDMSNFYLKQALRSDPLAMLGGLLASFALKRVKQKIDPRTYNGGVFLGLNGLCIKSHGGGDEYAFSSAVNTAIDLARQDYVQRVSNDMNHLMTQESFLAHGHFQE